jgi:hypothetical protein
VLPGTASSAPRRAAHRDRRIFRLRAQAIDLRLRARELLARSLRRVGFLREDVTLVAELSQVFERGLVQAAHRVRLRLRVPEPRLEEDDALVRAIELLGRLFAIARLLLDASLDGRRLLREPRELAPEVEEHVPTRRARRNHVDALDGLYVVGLGPIIAAQCRPQRRLVHPTMRARRPMPKKGRSRAAREDLSAKEGT